MTKREKTEPPQTPALNDVNRAIRPLRPPSRHIKTHGDQGPAPAPSAAGRRRIGLLGGSFDPAHEGHRHISLEALRRLDLDQVWWLIAPQNPLKPEASRSFEERRAQAEAMASHPKIVISDFDQRMNLRYSIDSVTRIQQAHDADFVFLIGADNLIQLHRWYRWQALMDACPIAVFDRNPYSIQAGMSKAAQCFAHARLQEADARAVVTRKPPAWVFIHSKPHPASSTEIRAREAKPASRHRTATKETKQ